MLEGTKVNSICHNQVIRFYVEKELSLEKTGKHFGVSPQTIRKILLFYKIPLRDRTKINSICHNQVIHLYVEKEFSLKKIGKHFNVSYGVIQKILLLHKVQLRDKSTGQKNRFRKQLLAKHGSEQKLKENMIKVYCVEKYPINKCCRELSVSPETFELFRKKFGIKKRKHLSKTNKASDKIDIEKAVFMYTKKFMSLPQIGKVFGVCPPVVSQVLKENGVTIRTLSEAKKIWHEKSQQKNENKKVKLPLQEDLSTKEKVIDLRKNKNAFIQDIAYSVGISEIEVLKTLKESNLV